MATRRIIIDIDGLPTAVIPRGPNEPPIVLYTLPPPSYSKHSEYELIEAGPPAPKIELDNDDDDDDGFDPFCCKWFCILCIISILISGTVIVMLTW